MENRFVGIKSRGVYETPGGAVLHEALRDLEGIAMDREVLRLRDMLSPRFAEIIYNGFWFSPEMDFIQVAATPPAPCTTRSSRPWTSPADTIRRTRGGSFASTDFASGPTSSSWNGRKSTSRWNKLATVRLEDARPSSPSWWDPAPLHIPSGAATARAGVQPFCIVRPRWTTANQARTERSSRHGENTPSPSSGRRSSRCCRRYCDRDRVLGGHGPDEHRVSSECAGQFRHHRRDGGMDRRRLSSPSSPTRFPRITSPRRNSSGALRRPTGFKPPRPSPSSPATFRRRRLQPK